MTMFHHDRRPYEEAASEAARATRPRLEKMILDARSQAAHVLETLETEQPKDSIVHASRMSWEWNAPAKELVMQAPDSPGGAWRVHEHAVRQAADRAGVRSTAGFIQGLADLARGSAEDEVEPWAGELAARTMTELFRHHPKRLLVRAVPVTRDDAGPTLEARGILSDSFRRLDGRPIVNAFIGECMRLGAVPAGGTVTALRVQLRAVIPAIFEPIPNEPMFFGAVITNSDFGGSRLSARLSCWRAWCTNLAIREEGLSLVHLGKRLSEDLAFSERTYRLDTATTASAVKDTVGRLLSNEAIEKEMSNIRRAHEEAVTPAQARGELRKLLHKGEADAALEAFKSPDVVNLPAGDTLYRLSNAVSWLAQGRDVPASRAMELTRIAGQILAPADEKKRELREEIAEAA